MPSSSSSEEDLSKFKEATDSTLYHDSLFNKGCDKKEESRIIIKPPSLRYMEDEEERLHNELKVTPEFQMHVAKHLSKLLDGQIEINDKSAGNGGSSDQPRSVLKAKRGKHPSGKDANKSNGGVRLLGASAVFLSNLNIVPQLHRRKKRGRKLACFSSGSESSSEDNDSDDTMLNSVIVPGKILSEGTAKYWYSKEDKAKKCCVHKSGSLPPVRDDISRGYESLNEISSSSNHNSKEVLNFGAKDDMAFLKIHKKKKSSHLVSELAASFSSVVSMGSDSQADATSKIRRKKMKKKKRRKEQHSEDATTETTEVEDVVEERKKKVKKGRKKPKRQRIEERKMEEMAMISECVPGLIEEDADRHKCKREEKKEKKRLHKEKRKELRRKRSTLDKEMASKYLKERGSLNKTRRGKVSKKKMSKNVSRLSEDLAKLMMIADETSCNKGAKL